MGFNYARERKKFEQEWSRLRKEYEEAGMSVEDIQSLYEFDLEIFRSERTYASHTQALPSEYIGEDGADCSTLFRKFASGTISFDETNLLGRHAWADALDDQRLVLSLRELSDEDLELLTFLVLEEHTQQEFAHKIGCTQKAVSKHFSQIKKIFKKRF